MHFKHAVSPDSFDVKAIRMATTSPDGKWLAFNAVGHIWLKELPSGKPKRITNSDDFEFDPAFSADGKKLTWVTWNDTAKGSVIMIDRSLGITSARKLDIPKGIYRTPRFSPDNSKIVYVKEEGNDHMGFTWCNDPGIYLFDLNSADNSRIIEDGEYPYFSAEGERIYFMTGGYLFGALDKAFKSCDLSGNDLRTHYTSKYANQFV
ncbi:MAG: hypothetical protein R2850_13440 [Bacteroidia bacterium]